MTINLTDLLASNYPEFTGGTVANAISITNTTQATSTTTGSLIASGGVGIAKKLHVGETGYFGSVSSIVLTNPLLVATGDANNYTQIQIQNKNAGASASSDFIATTDDGSDVSNYIDLGINSSGYSSASWTMSGARDGYLYVNGNNLTVGTDTAGKTVKIHTGGLLAANVVSTFNAANTNSTSTTTGSLVVTGGVGVANDIRAQGIYSNDVKLNNPEVFTFGGTGTPTTGTSMTPYVRVTAARTSVSASLVTKSAPTGNFTISILRSANNGTTFPDTVATVTVTSGNRVATASATTALAVGDLLRLDISAVNGAADWTAQLYTTGA